MKITHTHSDNAPKPDRNTLDKTYELSSRQMGLWLYQQREPESYLYNTSVAFRVKVPLQAVQLGKLAKQTYELNPALLTRFTLVEGVPKQYLAPEWGGEITYHEVASDENVEEKIAQLNKAPFDVNGGWLSRIDILVCGEQDYIVNFRAHHVVSDRRSSILLGKTLQALFLQSFDKYKEARLAFSADQYFKELLKADARVSHDLSYWREYLKETSLSLETGNFSDCSESDKRSAFEVNFVEFEIDSQKLAKIKLLTRRQRSIDFCFFASLYALLLHRVFGEDKFALGYIKDVRSREAMDMSGFFIELVPLVFGFNRSACLTSQLQRLRKVLSQQKKLQGLSTGSNLKQLGYSPQEVDNALNFAIGQANLDSSGGFDVLSEGDFELSLHSSHAGANNTALNLLIDTYGEQGHIRLNYSPLYFDRATINHLANALITLMDQALESPNKPFQEYELLAEKELVLMRQGIAYHEQKFSSCTNIAQIFVERSNAFPDSLAVIEEQRNFTYAEIERMSNAIGHGLLKDGVVAGDAVGVCMDRSGVFMASLLAILKIGAVYVPIVPTLPEQRVLTIIGDANIAIVLAQHQYVEKYESSCQIRIAEDYLACMITHHNIVSADVGLAAILYTSGSTGNPKGVQLEHRPLINAVSSYYDDHIQGDIIKVLARTSVGFDIALLELLGWFTASNGAVFMLPNERDMDLNYMIDAIEQYELTHCFFVPSVLQPFIDLLQRRTDRPKLMNMRVISAGGEKYSSLLCRQIYSGYYKHINFLSIYGPTETSIYTSSYDIRDFAGGAPHLPVGKSIPNVRQYVLDKNLKLLPKGIPGEICIGGVGVGRGYRNLPEKTAAAFVDNPFIPGEKLYRTGDWGKELEDGNLAVLGRFDEQVKLRGQRIELLEIEAAAQQSGAIEHAVAVIKTTPVGEALALYYTTSSAIDAEQIKSHLAGLLPGYMVPQYFIELDTIPMLMSGKTDRKTLRARPLEKPALLTGSDNGSLAQSEQHAQATSSTDYVRSVTEAKLLSVWRDVLQSQQVAVTDNFFDAGGHSLLVMDILQRVNQELGVELTVTDFFRAPNVRDMAMMIAPDDGLNDLPGLEWEESKPSQAIAVIGIACQFPRAANKDEFWANLVSGKEAISSFSESELLAAGECALVFSQPEYVARRGVLSNAKQFDNQVFNYSPRDAELIDPQQRLFLANAYHALEDGGYGNLSETQHIGVYGGAGFSDYANHVRQHHKFGKSISFYQMMTGNANDFLCTRVAYKLNLSGPAINIQTACSTSLVAVERACRDLRAGLCNMALAGGVSLVGGIESSGYVYQEGMILSPDGKCRSFDAEAGGTVPGQGVGVVLLKPLSEAVKDNDNIYAVIDGVAVNNDGNRKAGFTAPDINGQSDVIQLAHRDACITPQDITYLETHGTATPMGDPIEIAALAQVWQASSGQAGSRSAPQSDCHGSVQIGAVKSNLGHTDTAAGIAGLIKTALCLKHQLFVPTLHFNQPNPALTLENTPFAVNTKTRPWEMAEGKRRIAGVSAFGIGGTNVHVVIGEAPEAPNECADATEGADEAPCQSSGYGGERYKDNFDSAMLVPVSAATPVSLSLAEAKLQHFITETTPAMWADISYTAQVGRAAYSNRSCFVLQQRTTLNEDNVITLLTDEENPFKGMRQLSFCFYGVGSDIFSEHYVSLYKQCFIYADLVNDILDCFSGKLGICLKSYFAGTSHLDWVNWGVECYLFGFAAQLGFARLLQHCGMRFTSVLSEGTGELAACCFAGALEVGDAVNVLVRMQTESEVSLELSATPIPLYILSAQHWSMPGNKFAVTFSRVHQSQNRLDLNTVFTRLTRQNPACAKPDAVVSFVNDYLFDEHNIVEFDLLGFSVEPALYDLSAKLYAMLGYWWMAQNPFNWRALYPYGEPGRMSMPGYQYDTKTFWLNRPVDIRPFNGAADIVLDNQQPVAAHSAALPKQAPEAQPQQSDIQAILGQIWCEHLNLPAITPDDDFFELGGESLMAIGVFEDIEQRLNVKMQISVLYQASTLRLFVNVVEREMALVQSMVAAHVTPEKYAAGEQAVQHASQKVETGELSVAALSAQDVSATEQAVSPLVLLQQGTDPEQKPIFLVHAAGGGLIHFANMIKALGERFTVYGFEAPSLMTFDSIEAMAGCYLDALTKAFPQENKFIIGGHSFGGIVALEMGHQLKMSGRQLTKMLLIDPPGPDKMPQHTRYYSQILLHLCQGKTQLDEQHMRGLSLEAQIQYMRNKAGEQQWKLHFYYITPAYIRRFKQEVDMMHNYEFVPLDCDSIYFSPKELMPLLPDNMFESWEKLTLGSMQVVETEGNHITMVSERGAKTIASAIAFSVTDTLSHAPHRDADNPAILHS